MFLLTVVGPPRGSLVSRATGDPVAAVANTCLLGADLVDSAWSELNKIPKSSYANSQQPTSLLGRLGRVLIGSIPSRPEDESNPRKLSLSGPLADAVQLLEQAAKQNNSDALYLLAELNLLGLYSHPRDLRTAFRHYQRLADDHGNETAQFRLGMYYSTGLGNVVPQDQAKALLYYTFAAVRGYPRAEMAVAYRHHSGIGTPKSCENALRYYKSVADKAINWYRSGPPGGMSWVPQSWRISDDHGGIYGEGASASSAGVNAFKPGVHTDANAAIADVIEYLDLMSQKGDSKASFNLGRIYYEGQRGLQQNLELARKYFFLVASRYWKKDLREVEGAKQPVDKIAAKVAGYIGRMYLRGDGVNQNFEKAKAWFERGKAQGDAQSQYGLGLILLNGYGVKANIKLALELLRVSAEHDYAPAHVQMGKLYLDQGDQEAVRIANNHFELAARYGNLEANYYLAEMSYQGVGREKLCGMALGYYKNVAEKAEPLVSSWKYANEAYQNGDYDSAFIGYLTAAEQGYERAQTNVAYMLDSSTGGFSISDLLQSKTYSSRLLNNPKLALVYWTRSSRQSHVDSLVKMGDYYYYGIGAERDVKKALQCYTGASDFSQSAQALFNLGWMHENGVGLTQDFHLAKRYYDHALALNKEAYLPVTLSLLKLRVRSAWNTITRGPVHSIQDEPRKLINEDMINWHH